MHGHERDLDQQLEPPVSDSGRERARHAGRVRRIERGVLHEARCLERPVRVGWRAVRYGLRAVRLPHHEPGYGERHDRRGRQRDAARVRDGLRDRFLPPAQPRLPDRARPRDRPAVPLRDGTGLPARGRRARFHDRDAHRRGTGRHPGCLRSPGGTALGPAAHLHAGAHPRPHAAAASAYAGESRRQGKDREAAAERTAEEARQGRRPDAQDPPRRVAYAARFVQRGRLREARRREWRTRPPAHPGRKVCDQGQTQPGPGQGWERDPGRHGPQGE